MLQTNSAELALESELWLQTLGWSPNAVQQQQFQQLYQEILQGNQQLNLTRITEPSRVLRKTSVGFAPRHFAAIRRGCYSAAQLD